MNLIEEGGNDEEIEKYEEVAVYEIEKHFKE